MRRVVILIAIAACRDRTESKPVPVAIPATTGSDVAVAAPKPDPRPRVRPKHAVDWHRPQRAASDQESLLAGTWVAKVGDFAPRSAAMADKVMYALDRANPDLVSNALAAIEADNKLASSCIWLELRAGFTGYRRECAIVNGQPSALDQNDIATGKKRDLGVAVEWFIDAEDKNKLKIRYAEDMVVPALHDGKLALLVFRTHYLQLDKADAAGGKNYFLVKEWFPEHDYALPTEYSYFIASGEYLK